MVNLHKVVRGAIHAIHSDEKVRLYQSTGEIWYRGKAVSQYQAYDVIVQFQNTPGEQLQTADAVNRTGYDARVYFFTSEEVQPGGVDKITARGGDFIKRKDGSWWLVTGVGDDFSEAGWMCLNVTRQTFPPKGIEE